MKKFDCTRDRAIRIIKEEGGECSSFRFDRLNVLDFELFRGPERIKCYECEQLYFIKLLDQIIEGKELGEITGLLGFLNAGVKEITRDVVFSKAKPGAPFKQKLDTQIKWRNPIGVPIAFTSGPDNNHPYKHIFNDFFRSIIVFSLAEFLHNNDRRQLKTCFLCNKYFAASKNDDRIRKCPACYTKRSMPAGQKREYMRKYRQRKKRGKKLQQEEAKIANYMRNDYTREEALRIIEADSKL